MEGDAETRLSLVPASSSDPVEQATSVRVPTSLRQSQVHPPAEVSAADFDYRVVSGDPSLPVRLPVGGWRTDGIDDTVRCIEQLWSPGV